MRAVTMVSITHFWPSARVDRPLRWLALACALALPVAASAQNADLESLRVERTDEGLLLSARLNIRLPGAVEEALDKGIPIHFVADTTVMRERWYWTDQRVSASQRYMRVAYMPLTRRWRLNTSSEPLTNAGLGVSLTQHYDTLAEVMSSVGRFSRWKIASAADMDSGSKQSLRFQFRLDSSQLPRTIQLGSPGQASWTVGVDRTVDLTQESIR